MENFGTPIELNFKKSWSREKKEFMSLRSLYLYSHLNVPYQISRKWAEFDWFIFA